MLSMFLLNIFFSESMHYLNTKMYCITIVFVIISQQARLNLSLRLNNDQTVTACMRNRPTMVAFRKVAFWERLSFQVNQNVSPTTYSILSITYNSLFKYYAFGSFHVNATNGCGINLPNS